MLSPFLLLFFGLRVRSSTRVSLALQWYQLCAAQSLVAKIKIARVFTQGRKQYRCFCILLSALLTELVHTMGTSRQTYCDSII